MGMSLKFYSVIPLNEKVIATLLEMNLEDAMGMRKNSLWNMFAELGSYLKKAR